MAGWDSVGTGLGDLITGNPNGNALNFAKGANMGANTEVALAKARESVAQEQARQGLRQQLVAAGVPDAVAGASSGALSAGAGLGDVIALLGKQQEQGFRKSAVDAALGNDLVGANANLIGVASGPVERYASAGEGMLQDKFSANAPAPTALGDALVGQRNAAAALDDEHRLHPERFLSRSAQGPKIVDMQGIKYEYRGNDENGAPIMVPLLAADAQAKNAANIASSKAAGKTVGGNAAGLSGALNDLDTMTGNVDKLLMDPNMSDIYGANVGQLTRFVPGTGSARASGIRTQLGSEAFSAAVQKMRGLGQLSNAEGLKVQTALTRALDPNLSPEDAKVALGELKLTLANLRKVAVQQAGGEDKLVQLLGGGAAPATAPAAASTAPATENASGKDFSSLWN